MKLAGLVIGTYLGLINGINPPQEIIASPYNAMSNLITGITGYDMEAHVWTTASLPLFWGPVAAFWALDVIGKRLLHTNVKLTKELSLF